MTGEADPVGVPLQRLWAAWRMRWVKTLGPGGGDGECVFCELPGSDDGPGNLIVHRGETCYAVLNLYPYNSGHAMVVPFRHVGSLAELTDVERSEMLREGALLELALSRGMQAQGFNLGINLGRVGGAGIPGHLHMHLVPRWAGDTNFMAVVAETKVLPESLKETYERVREAVQDAIAGKGTSG